MLRTFAREAHREVSHTWVNVAGGKAAGSSSASGVVLHSALAHRIRGYIRRLYRGLCCGSSCGNYYIDIITYLW